MIDPIAYYAELSNNQYCYELEFGNIYLPPFSTFNDRIKSVQRYWELINPLIKNHVDILNKVPTELLKKYKEEKEIYEEKIKTGKIISNEEHEYFSRVSEAEVVLDFEDEISFDTEFMPEYLGGSIITLSLSLLENLMNEVAKSVAEEYNIKFVLPSSKQPFINKYLHYFTNNCGFNITLEDNENERLDIIRQVRNKFIHEINRELPKEIEDAIKRISDTVEDKKFKINDLFISTSLFEICSLAKKLEIAYLNFRNSKKL